MKNNKKKERKHYLSLVSVAPPCAPLVLLCFIFIFVCMLYLSAWKGWMWRAELGTRLSTSLAASDTSPWSCYFSRKAPSWTLETAMGTPLFTRYDGMLPHSPPRFYVYIYILRRFSFRLVVDCSRGSCDHSSCFFFFQQQTNGINLPIVRYSSLSRSIWLVLQLQQYWGWGCDLMVI